MGFKVHTTLKCHTCKRKKPLGGMKKMGSREETDDWKMVRLDKIAKIKGNKVIYIWLCPPCCKKRGI